MVRHARVPQSVRALEAFNRRLEILSLLARGYPQRAVAEALAIAPSLVARTARRTRTDTRLREAFEARMVSDARRAMALDSLESQDWEDSR